MRRAILPAERPRRAMPHAIAIGEPPQSSPWLSVGSAALTAQQAGYTFQFDQPADGRPKQVRALAEVQWREGATVIRSTSAGTQAGAASDVGGSQASCTLS